MRCLVTGLSVVLMTCVGAAALADGNSNTPLPKGLGLPPGTAKTPVKADSSQHDASLSGGAMVGSDALETLQWTGTPMPLSLPIGQDRVVRFPNEVRVGPPGKLADALQLTSADGAVYCRALRPFEPTLVLVQETKAPGRTFALQLSGEPGASNKPVEILAPNEVSAATTTPASVTPSAEITPESQPPKRLSYVALTRFAALQIYAPSRLLRLMDGVYQSPVPTKRLVPLIRASAVLGDIEATPLGSWSEDAGLYVTAIQLRNRSPRAIELDPRTALRGEWLAATFQHYRLLPAGNEADTSTVYVISEKPFLDALGLPRGPR